MPPRYCIECSINGAICDFCKHYDFRANAQGAYTGDGYCNKHERHEDPDSGCDDFECFRGDEIGWATEPPGPMDNLLTPEEVEELTKKLEEQKKHEWCNL